MNEKTKISNAKEIAKRIGSAYYWPRETWLTSDIAREYTSRAAKLPDNGGQDTGERRRLRIELQEYCGITELEATNILRGFHTADYVKRYDYISRLMPYPYELDKVEGDLEMVRKYIYEYGRDLEEKKKG